MFYFQVPPLQEISDNYNSYSTSIPYSVHKRGILSPSKFYTREYLIRHDRKILVAYEAQQNLPGLSREGFRHGKSGDPVNRIVLSKAYIGKRKGPGKPSITSECSVV